MFRGVILEGPNGAGKSTLAAALAESTGWEVKKCPTPENAAEVGENKRAFLASRVADPAPIIWDRCPQITDVVYRDIPGTRYEMPERLLEGFILVAVTAPLSALCRARPNAEIEELIGLGNAYRHYLPTYAARFGAADLIWHDWTTGVTVRDLLERVEIARRMA